MRFTNVCAGILITLLCADMAVAIDQPDNKQADDTNSSTKDALETKKANEVPEWAAKRSNPLPPSLASIQYGEKIYRLHCTACHGEKLAGDGWVGRALDPEPADLNERVPEHTDGQLAWRISRGNKGMPGWKRVIAAEDIWHVINYLRKYTDSFEIDQTEVLNMKHDYH